MIEIRAEQLSQHYPATGREPIRALSEVTLCVSAGEALAVVGPSGSGKSTLLRLIAGLESPSAGRVLFNGQSVLDRPPAERGVFMVFQGAPLYPNLNVIQNLERAQQSRRGEVDKGPEIASILERFRLEARRASYPDQLSEGERQRVALGRALLLQPEVLLLDEPLANLDPELRFQLRWEIAEVTRALGATLIYVTHDPFEAGTLGDRVAVLDQGCLQQVDHPAELERVPANRFVAGFMQFPPMNFIPGTVRPGGADGVGHWRVEGMPSSDSGAIRAEWVKRLAEQSERAVSVGVRPDDLVLSQEPVAENANLGRGKVVRVEAFHGRRLIYVASHSARWVATDRHTTQGMELGAQVWASAPWERIHWFDAGSGKRLGEVRNGT